ncbi:hypothetical protein FACS1894105_05650 [Clostridia bacterium]|nr:hypothetical protein FACS1894105_05650 [Clostridia bacterium]
MKRTIIFCAAVFVTLFFCSSAAAASDSDSVTEKKTAGNVLITVVLPEYTSAPEMTDVPMPQTSAPAVVTMYPVRVSETFDNGVRQIIKTYELSANEKPKDIPREDFEQSSWKYTLTDIVMKETAKTETRRHIETVTLNTDTNEPEKIITLLGSTKEYKSADNFAGILTLDVTGIKTVAAGTKTTSYEMKVTREYPHLSANDSSLVPKTVTDNGKTYTLAGIDWKAGNYITVDYEQVPEYYTANAVYTATVTSTKVTGYITTAEYCGTIAKISQGKTIYTAYFTGEEIRTPLATEALTPAESETTEPATEIPAEPVTEPTASSETTIEVTETLITELVSGEDESTTDTIILLYGIIAVLVLFIAATTFILTYRRKTHNDETDKSDTAADDSGSDDDSGGGK